MGVNKVLINNLYCDANQGNFRDAVIFEDCDMLLV